MKRSVLLGLLLAVGSLSIVVRAGTDVNVSQGQAGAPQEPRTIDIVKLKDNLYVLTSSTPGNAATFSGGNVAVFITDGGVTLVDTKLAGWGQAVLDKLKTVTDKPVTRIINTHTHGDHTGNNDLFGATVDIVAQETRKRTCRRWMPSRATRRSSCRSAPTRTRCRSGRARIVSTSITSA